MKTILFPFLLALFSFGSLSAQVIEFKTKKYNFGFVHEGDVVHMEFFFTNTGDQDLVISGYDVECGCTVVELPGQAIAPGKSGVIKVNFDTQNKYDRQDRLVSLECNAKNAPVVLRFKGVVLKPKKTPDP